MFGAIHCFSGLKKFDFGIKLYIINFEKLIKYEIKSKYNFKNRKRTSISN